MEATEAKITQRVGRKVGKKIQKEWEENLGKMWEPLQGMLSLTGIWAHQVDLVREPEKRLTGEQWGGESRSWRGDTEPRAERRYGTDGKEGQRLHSSWERS